MPSLPKIPGTGPLGAIGAVRNFVDVVKEIDFGDVREQANTAPKVLAIANDESTARRGLMRLFGTDSEPGLSVLAVQGDLALNTGLYDLAIVVEPSGSSLNQRVRKAVGTGWEANVFHLTGHETDLEANEALRQKICARLTHLAPSLGRNYITFRPAATKAVVEEAAKVNGRFALISNVPAIVPVLGGLVAVGADLVVLTKNQIMMCYKVAAIHGRDLDDQIGVIRELTPVVGAGFMWRTAARSASALLPFAAGTIPKVVIAFAGTYSTGKAVEYFYKYGQKPTTDQLKALSAQATEIAKQVPWIAKAIEQLPTNRQDDVIEGEVIENSETTTKL